MTLQPRVRRPIDFADPTHAKQGGDFVDAEAGAGREAKGLPWILWAGRQPGLDYSCLTALCLSTQVSGLLATWRLLGTYEHYAAIGVALSGLA